MEKLIFLAGLALFLAIKSWWSGDDELGEAIATEKRHFKDNSIYWWDFHPVRLGLGLLLAAVLYLSLPSTWKLWEHNWRSWTGQQEQTLPQNTVAASAHSENSTPALSHPAKGSAHARKVSSPKPHISHRVHK